MTNEALIAELRKRDPHGDVQIYVRDSGDHETYFEIKGVNGFINGPDTVLEAGEVIATGG